MKIKESRKIGIKPDQKTCQTQSVSSQMAIHEPFLKGGGTQLYIAMDMLFFMLCMVKAHYSIQ